MQYKRSIAVVAAFVLGLSGSLVANPAQAFVPIVKPSVSSELPPAPTKQDKAYKPSTKEKTAKKGLPSPHNKFNVFSCPCYNYVAAAQQFPAGTTGDGIAANLPVENTFIKTTAPADYHVLAQLSLQNTAGSGQAIEFGVTRDFAVFGDWQPRLFAGYIKNGVWAGYGAGFVDYAPNTTWTYGSAVTVVPGTQRRFEIKYSGGNFWLAYDAQWVGYIQGSVFTAAPSVTFTNGDFMQAFMEEVGPNVNSCSDLGNGQPASSGTASRLGSMNITGITPPTAVSFTPYLQPAGALGYTVTALSATSVRGGGPGANAALTGVGTTGSC
jgi:hypothetical protein